MQCRTERHKSERGCLFPLLLPFSKGIPGFVAGREGGNCTIVQFLLTAVWRISFPPSTHSFRCTRRERERERQGRPVPGSPISLLPLSLLPASTVRKFPDPCDPLPAQAGVGGKPALPRLRGEGAALCAKTGMGIGYLLQKGEQTCVNVATVAASSSSFSAVVIIMISSLLFP